MKYLFVLLFLLNACELSKKVVAVTSTVTTDTIYTLRAEDGTTCFVSAREGRNILLGDLYACIW